MTLNCLFITADQWRGDCLSLRGHPCVKTPNLDKLADDGVYFANHFSQATPCGPSRASIYTGLYAFNHRSIANGKPLDHRHQTLAQIARRHGYDPTLFGYTDTSMDPRTLPQDDPRLRTYEGLCPGFRAELMLNERMLPWIDYLDMGIQDVDEVYHNFFGNPARFSSQRSETALVANSFIDWISHPQKQPWFAHLSFIKPHPPWIAAEPYHSMVSRADVPMPDNPSLEADKGLHPWLKATLETPFHGWLGDIFDDPERLSAEAVREIRAIYFGLVNEVDHHLGRIIETLAASGALEKTLIVFTSDHGEMLGERRMLGKSGFFPQAFHVPLIIRDPRGDRTRGRRVEAFSEHVDLMPTILDRLGIPVPGQCDGQKLSNFLTDETEPQNWRDAVYFEHDFYGSPNQGHSELADLDRSQCGLVVRMTQKDAYVHFSGLPALAFDLENDPGWRSPVSDPAWILPKAQAMLNWRMQKAERRLTAVSLTHEGPKGSFDPL